MYRRSVGMTWSANEVTSRQPVKSALAAADSWVGPGASPAGEAAQS